jgi:glyoxylase-like metal-dependent hydrolase (beta-lactamase superfamily II)
VLGLPLRSLEAPAPFAPILLGTPPGWKEIALWWPERQVLVCGDALGTQSYFRTEEERLGVHPLLRLIPPRRLARLAPQHVLVGHGEGVHEDATAALREALTTSRRRLPAALEGAIRAIRQSRSK